MEREEAINLIKQVLPCLNIDEKIREGFVTLIPELKESEDEKVRKALIDGIRQIRCKNGVTQEQMLAWLEKQKEEEGYEAIPVESTLEYKLGFKAGKDSERQKDDNSKTSASEDERIRKELIEYLTHRTEVTGFIDEDKDCKRWIAYLEKQKEQKPECDNETEVQKAYREGKNAGRKEVLDHPEYYGLQLRRMYDYETGERNPEWSDEDKKMLLSIINAFRNETVSTIGQEQWLKNLPERFNLQQKPAESDAIKGGDFISDGKRVFLVLANVKERNLGETDSTFCESHILGVDGVVYCDGDNFKKFKRATSDERAKFIHDLKVGVELKEQPAEWSEDWEEDIQTRFAFYTYKDDPSVLYLSNVFVEETSRNHGFGTRILKAAEKAAEAIGAITICLKVKQDSPANAWYRKRGYGYVAFEDGYDWLEKNLEYLKPAKSAEWSEEDEEMLKSILFVLESYVSHSESASSPSLITSYPIYYKEIDWLKSLRPSWKPSEEQMEILQYVCTQSSHPNQKVIPVLESLYNDLKKL